MPEMPHRMTSMSRLSRFVTAAVLVLSVSSSAYASCMPDDMNAASTEMACCMHGNHDCGPAMQPADCCSSHSVAAQKFVATKPPSSAKPLLTACEFLPAPAADTVPAEMAGHPSFRVTVSSPPLFLLVSSLRI